MKVNFPLIQSTLDVNISSVLSMQLYVARKFMTGETEASVIASRYVW